MSVKILLMMAWAIAGCAASNGGGHGVGNSKTMTDMNTLVASDAKKTEPCECAEPKKVADLNGSKTVDKKEECECARPKKSSTQKKKVKAD